MSLFTRSKPKRWSSLLILAILCLTLVQPAFAAVSPAPTDPIALLRQYNIVRGDNTGNLQLGAPITRAQMAVILVRITGRETEAEGLKGMGLFGDTKDHWADGYVAAARIYGLMKGFEDGNFKPEEPVTYAQAFTLVLRLVGREPDPNNWPTSALLEAMDIKVVPASFTGIAMLNEPALRGEIFTAMAQALTTVKTADGKTYFQKWVDSTAPELTVSDNATLDATFQLAGTVKGAEGVTINGEPASLIGDVFSKTVALNLGENRFTLEAYDLAGNKTTKEVKVVRKTPAAAVSIVGPAKVPINGTATYEIKAFDADNREVPAAGVQAKVTGAIGTFNAATGTFTAGGTAASGKIEITLGTATASAYVQVLGASAQANRLTVSATNVAYTRPMTVTVQVLDAEGALVTEDYGRTISLSASGITGLVVSPQQATTIGGVATFTVRGTATGNVSLAASSQGLAGDTEVATFTTTTRVVLVTDQTRIPTDGSLMARIRAELRDETGELVTNKTGKDIEVTLDITGPGTLLNSRVRIAPNASSSAQTQTDGMVGPMSEAGTISVRGTLLDSTLKYSVERVSINAYTPSVGAGTTFRVTPLSGNITLGGTNTAEFIVQLVDSHGSVISANDYAFQVEVSTSNNEAKTAGVPAGMTVKLGDNATLNPVSDGKSGGDDIVARTDRGSALIKVTYGKPGTVTLKVVAASGTSEAYNTDGVADEAVSSSAGWVTEQSKAEAFFKVTANTIKLTADSDLFGKDTPAISHRSGATRTYTLSAYVAYSSTPSDPDAPRYWVPGQVKTLDLYKNGVKLTSGEARDGKATFSITASATSGHEDVYEVRDPAASNKLETSNEIYVRTEGSAPQAPGFPVVRGVPSLTLDQVLADDTGLEIDLPVDTTQRYVIVRVFSDTNNAIYTSGPIDVSGGTPTVTVPKANIPAGVHTFSVRYRNAYGESGTGVASYPVTNFTLSTNVSITSAKYDAVNQVLYVYGNGFSSDDAIAGEKLRLYDPTITDPTPNDGNHPGIVYLGGATRTHVNNSQFKLDLGSVSDVSKLASFAGSVRLSAEVGWITKASGQMGNADRDNAVGPMAYIASAAYDRSNRRLVIYGRGFKTGTLKAAELTVGTHALNENGMSVSVPYDTEIWVTLNANAAAEVEANAAIKLTADDNWLTDGAGTPIGRMAAISDIDVYGFVKPSSVTYYEASGLVTISGNGFANGRVSSGAVVRVVREGATTLTLTNGTVTADGKVTFTFASAADQTNFETNYNTYRSQTYLVADQGWFEVPAGAGWRDSADIPLTTGLRIGIVRD